MAKTSFPGIYSVRVTILLLATTISLSLQGEEYRYTVRYTGIPISNVTITTDTAGSFWQGTYSAEVRGLFRYLFDIDNTYKLTAEPETWKAHRYTKTIREGNFHAEQVFRYPIHGTTNQVILPDSSTRMLSPETRNLFSALLWLQHHNWEPGETHSLPVEIDGTVWGVEIQSETITRIRSGNTRVKCLLLEVTFREKLRGYEFPLRTDYLSKFLPAKGRILRIWLDFSTDTIHRIIVPMGPFTVKAFLEENPR